MANKPGRTFTRQAAEPPVVARNINQGLPVLEALDRMGVGHGASIQWLPGGIPLIRGLIGSLNIRKAKTPSAGITAKNTSDNKPGKAQCQVYTWDGTAEVLQTDKIDVYNSQASAVAGSSDIWVVALDRTSGGDGDWFVLPGVSSPGMRIARTPAGGIPAKSGTTPGSATCTFYVWNGTSHTLGSETATVRNANPAAFDANRVVYVTFDQGSYWAVVESCS